MNRLTYSLKTVFRSRGRSFLLMLLVFLASVLLCMGWTLKRESDIRVAEAVSTFKITGLFEEKNDHVDLWEEEYRHLKGLDYIQVDQPFLLTASSPMLKGDANPLFDIAYKTAAAYSQTEENATLCTEDQSVFTFRYVGEGYAELLSILAGVEYEYAEPVPVYNYSSNQEPFEEGQTYIAYGSSANYPERLELFDFDVKGYCGVEKEAEASDYWEEICSVVERTFFPLTVMSTRSAEHLYAFHENKAVVREGELFSQEMYDEGQKVCVISSKLAKDNDIQVGDEIPLFFYESNYVMSYRWSMAGSMNPDKTEALHAYLSEETFRVVGIYSFAVRDEEKAESKLDERMILVPEGALTPFFPEDVAADYMVGRDLRELENVTIHLKPEDMNRFRKDMSSLVSLKIQLYDQGYSQMKNSLLSFQELANVLLSVGIICAVMVCCFVGYFEGRARAMERKVYRALGFPWKEIILRFALSLALICLPGIIGGCVCGQIASKHIVETAFQEGDTIHFYEGIDISQ